MHDHIYIKNYDERVNTVDSLLEKSYEHPFPFEEAFKNLQFKHRTLQHQYAVLENQFQLYSSQTYGKISSLQKDMDQLVQQKDKAFKTVSQENKTLKEQNSKLRSEILALQSEVDRQTKKSKANENELKNTVFSFQKSESKQRQIVMNFQRELSVKIEQVQSLKDILNNQRMAALSKDQLIITKDNQIVELLAQIKSMAIQLDSQRQIQGDIRDSNHKLKREVQELRIMFDEMESGLRNFEKCQILQRKNSQLVTLLKQKESRKDFSYSIERPVNRRTIDHSNSRFDRLNNTNASFGRNYLADLSVDDIRPTRDFYQGRSIMKNSVVRRCKVVLDKD